MHASSTYHVQRRPRTHAVRRRFGSDYEQLVRLRDGRTARIVALRPGHAARLVAGFERLSSRSRYYRFLVPKSRLTPEEVRYFTRIDGEHHYALAALVETKDGWDGAGTARIVRHAHHSARADLAVTILDEYQGCGLGSALVDRILDAAAERGYQEVTAEVLAQNRGMMRLLHQLAPDLRRLDCHQGVVRLAIPLTGRQRRRGSRLRRPRPAWH